MPHQSTLAGVAGAAEPAAAVSLGGLLADLTAADPDAVLLRDTSARAALCDRVATQYSRAAALSRATGIATRLAGLRLPAGDVIGICLPPGPEAWLAVLATTMAGLTPCLLPLSLSEPELRDALERADARVVVTQTVFGDLRPAEIFAALAAGLFRVRFLLAFGPDVPDGIVDLDRARRHPLDGGEIRTAPSPGAGLVTIEHRAATGGLLRYRTIPALIAAGTVVLAATRFRRHDVVLTYLAPDDLKGLSTGLVPCLICGATLAADVFSAELVAAALAQAPRTHLVLPGWTEPIVSGLNLAAAAASIVFVHSSPDELPRAGSPRAAGRIVDVLALGETALVAAPRSPDGACAIALDGSSLADPFGLLEVRTSHDGSIEARGLAACVLPLSPDVFRVKQDPTTWRPCGAGSQVSAFDA